MNAESLKTPTPAAPKEEKAKFQAMYRDLCGELNMYAVPEVEVTDRSRLVPTPNMPSHDKAVGSSTGSTVPMTSAVEQPAAVYFRPKVQIEVSNGQKQHQCITHIYIRGWKVDSAMLTILHQCWLTLQHLNTANLWNAGLDHEVVIQLSAVLKECPQIRTVILDNNPVKSEPWHVLLSGDSTITCLSLRYNGITDEGVEQISSRIGTTTKQNKALLQLDLTGNKITDAGAAHLVNALRLNRTLASLSLAGNLIGDAAAEKLAEVLTVFELTHEEIVERRKLINQQSVRKLSSVNTENTTTSVFLSPLLDEVVGPSQPGTLILRGNRTIASVNLANNAVTEVGAEKLLWAVEHQLTPTAPNRPETTGIRRLNLQNNQMDNDCPTLQLLRAIMPTEVI